MGKETDFWGGGNPPAAPEPLKKSDAEPIKKRDFDWRWLLIGGVAAAALIAAAVVININLGQGNSSSDVTSGITIDNGDSKINWERYPTTEVELTGSYTITESGTYHFTGSVDDGMISVNVKDGVVRIMLDNVSIKNSSGPAIACYEAEDLVIKLYGDNYIEDAKTYGSNFDEDVTGAIYSKADLSFDGEGSLTLTANYADGIVGKDDVKFNSGTYKITAADDGIRGKDSVYVTGGDFTIKASGDGIKSTNETDADKGFVLIEGGTFAINAGAKGIKAINSVLIYGGEYTINSTDDAVHSNKNIAVSDGELTIASSDDGMHADSQLLIDGGKIKITKSYEGLEAQKITINGGELSVTANDDGLNAGGGADQSAMNRVGAGTFDADENCELIIGGGSIYVNAAGDGVDSNGTIYFNGGTVVVDGPTNNGNGALDSGMAIYMNGGSVIAIGASGMAETLGSSSTVYNASIYLSTTQKAGTKIEIKNSAGETIISHTSAKTFNHIAVGTEKFKNGETYTLYLDGTESGTFSFSGSTMTTTVGNGNANYQNMNNAAQKGQMR